MVSFLHNYIARARCLCKAVTGKQLELVCYVCLLTQNFEVASTNSFKCSNQGRANQGRAAKPSGGGTPRKIG